MYETGIGLIDVFRVAAATDADAAQDWKQVSAERQKNIEAALPESDARARDVVRALLAPDLYFELVERGSWSPDEYETWLSAALGMLVMPT